MTVPARSYPSSPRVVDVSLTGACNLACRTCFYADEMVRLTDLPTDAWTGFFAECNAAGVMKLVLSGGDVFMRRDLFELIDAIVANRMRYAILTNGTFLSPKMVDRFLRGKRRQRLDYIQVSIDGPTPTVHDRVRNPGSFRHALAGLARAKAARLPVVTRVTINRLNVAHAVETFEILRTRVGLANVGINSVFPRGAASACNHGADIGLTTADRVTAMQTCVAYETRFPGVLSGSAGPLVDARYFAFLDRLAQGKAEPPPGRGTLSACGAPFSKMAVLHDGTITPCNIMPGMRVGRIGETPLLEIWRENAEMAAMRARPAVTLERFADCATCDYRPGCTGGCPGVGEELTGNFHEPNPIDCYRQFRRELASAGIEPWQWDAPTAAGLALVEAGVTAAAAASHPAGPVLEAVLA